MTRKFYISLVIVMLAAGFFSFTNQPSYAEPVPLTEPIESKDEAAEIAVSQLAGLSYNDLPPADREKIEVHDVRLLRHRDAFLVILGGEPIYSPELSSKPDTLVWFVTVTSPQVENLPMFAEGPVDYSGAIFGFEADTGEQIIMASVINMETDATLQKLRALESLEGKVEITAETTAEAADQNLLEKIFLPLLRG